ncbi:unnamed protein product [Moneuplotes crassus]|uniref:LITAF domain-containing protein n=1 Tax=Euplotes crassus TaxID=5936 RepID=A0AAD1Y3I2_EUPCR|nr:unnamed protein product [Moneuplotes crassus]
MADSNTSRVDERPSNTKIVVKRKPQSIDEELAMGRSVYFIEEAVNPKQVRCPKCYHNANTVVNKIMTPSQWGAAICLACCCLCWMPFVMKQAYIYQHCCAACGEVIQTYNPTNLRYPSYYDKMEE